MSEPAVDTSVADQTTDAPAEGGAADTSVDTPARTTLIDGVQDDQADSPNNDDSSDSSADEGGKTSENGGKPDSADESDSKDDDSAADDEGKDSKDDNKDDAKPDNVFELKIPEGSKLSQAEAEEISTFAKEQNLSQDQAQAVLDFQSKVNGQIMENAQTLVLEQAEKTNQTNSDNWLKEVKSHGTLGGDNFKSTAEKMKRFSDAFVPQTMKDFLNQTGYGNNPAVAELFTKLYDELGMGEDNTDQRS